MSSTALRAVRELRGDSAGGDGRPFTPRGERPGTATAGGMRAASPDSVSPAAFEALKKELDDTRLALEKEKRSDDDGISYCSAERGGAATAAATADERRQLTASSVCCPCRVRRCSVFQ
jgi:hypothetical protein